MVGVRHTLDCKDCDCSLAVWRREAGRLSWCSPLWLWAAASSSAAVGSAAAASAAASATAVLAAVLAGARPGAGLASGGGVGAGLESVWTSVACSDWDDPVGGGLGIPPPTRVWRPGAVCACCPGPATSIWPCVHSVETLAVLGSVGTLDSPPPAAPRRPPLPASAGRFGLRADPGRPARGAAAPAPGIGCRAPGACTCRLKTCE